MSLVVLTGASGSGKTTLAMEVSRRLGERVDVHFFDSIGVPSFEDMAAEQGSIENWQRVKTIEWMQRIGPMVARGNDVLFEGQMRIAFIEEALATASIASSRIVLVDCNEPVRTRRLVDERGQPDLANPQMMNWARFLRNEALTRQHEVLDTSASSIADCTDRICRYF